MAECDWCSLGRKSHGHEPPMLCRAGACPLPEPPLPHSRPQPAARLHSGFLVPGWATSPEHSSQHAPHTFFQPVHAHELKSCAPSRPRDVFQAQNNLAISKKKRSFAGPCTPHLSFLSRTSYCSLQNGITVLSDQMHKV